MEPRDNGPLDAESQNALERQEAPNRGDPGAPDGNQVAKVQNGIFETSEDEAIDHMIEVAQSGQSSELRSLFRQVFHSGPIPSSTELQKYDNVLPGLAGRLVSMAEREQDIRGKETSHNNWNVTFKVFASVVVSSVMVGGGVFCAYIGEPVVGGAIATSGVIAGVFQSYFRSPPRKGGGDAE